MILNDVDNLIEETSIKKEIEHYKELKDVPGKVLDNPKLAVKITKNITKDLIKDSPSIITGFTTGLDPEGIIKTINQKRNPLKHPIDTALNITSGGWGKLIKTTADSTIKSSKDHKK